MMNLRGAFLVALAALSTARALATGSGEEREAAVTPVQSKDIRPGYGVVESVSEVRVVPQRSAAAGGSAPSPSEGRPMYRIRVRMADGGVQLRDLDKPEFKAGDKVLLTNAGDILPDD
jgi:hypothetical protein